MLKHILILLAVLCLAHPALCDDIVISNDGGPVKITIRNDPTTARPTATRPDQQTTLRIITDVLAEYSSKYTYSEMTQTQSKQMSEAIWYRLRVKGIPVRLAGGNIEQLVTGQGFEFYTNTANHAWVLAQTPDQGWLALECTTGRVVPRKENPLYYTSAIFFHTPDEVYRFDGLRRKAANTLKQFNAKREDWNTKYAGKTLNVGTKQHTRMKSHKQSVQSLYDTYMDHVNSLEGIYKRGQTLK